MFFPITKPDKKGNILMKRVSKQFFDEIRLWYYKNLSWIRYYLKINHFRNFEVFDTRIPKLKWLVNYKIVQWAENRLDWSISDFNFIWCPTPIQSAFIISFVKLNEIQKRFQRIFMRIPKGSEISRFTSILTFYLWLEISRGIFSWMFQNILFEN